MINRGIKVHKVGSTYRRMSLSGTRGTRKEDGDSKVRYSRAGGVFIGPSIEGTDKEYVKVISGKVSDRKPTFA